MLVFKVDGGFIYVPRWLPRYRMILYAVRQCARWVSPPRNIDRAASEPWIRSSVVLFLSGVGSARRAAMHPPHMRRKITTDVHFIHVHDGLRSP